MVIFKRFVSNYPYFCRKLKIDCNKYKIDKHKNNISATKIFNYMNNNPLLDWLDLYHSQNDKVRDEFSVFLKEQGNLFEEKIVKIIQDKGNNVVRVSDKYSSETVKTTIKYMKEGIPIIHSAPIFNEDNNTYGIIDILIRSDYINKLFNERVLDENLEKFRAPNLNGNYHYLVIDIKYKTINLRNNGIHIINTNNIQSYKGQIYIYNQAISKIQGYNSNIGFILGNRYKYSKDGIKYTDNNPLSRLGTIDYTSIDKNIPKRVNKAIKWYKELKKSGKDWDINNPSRIELYPNLKKDNGEWSYIVNNLAKNNNDITMIWNCGKKNRDIAISKDVKNWNDNKCTTKILGFENSLQENIISNILEINKNIDNFIKPDILSEISKELIKNNDNEIFLDFETFQDFENNNNSIVFLIGVYHYDCNLEKYIYKKFLIDTIDSEKNNIQDFLNFYKSLENPKIFYWYAEKNIWKNNILKKYPEFSNIIVESDFIDIYRIFRQEPIVIKGCFNYGLKTISQKMNEHNMINISLDTNCKSGRDAMLHAYKVYKNKMTSESDKILKDITDYNKFDVEALYQILNFLRKNYKV